ncbi:MAG: hypothetical protein HY601_02580, partial [Candidatus Omnitrophica bacterium]|nr:hypothetical protein [Candidatus Omnitrophota bacterium]
MASFLLLPVCPPAQADVASRAEELRGKIKLHQAESAKLRAEIDVLRASLSKAPPGKAASLRAQLKRHELRIAYLQRMIDLLEEQLEKFEELEA